MGVSSPDHDGAGDISGRNAKHQPWFLEIASQTQVARAKAYWLSLFSNSLAMLMPIYVLQVYDKVVFYHNLNTLTGLLLGMFVVIIFEFGFRSVRARILRGIAIHNDVFATSSLFRRMLAMPMRELERRSTAVWNNLFGDIDRIRNRLSGPMAIGFMDFPFAFLMLILMYIIARPIFMVPVIFIALVLIVIWRADVVMNRNVAYEQQQIQNRSGRIADLIGARETLKAMNMNHAAYVLWAKSQTSVIDRSLVRGTNHDFYESLGQTLVLLSSVILVALGALAIIEGSMTLGGLIAANMLSSRALGVMIRMISLWRGYRESIESEKRLDTIFAIQEEPSFAPIPLLDWKGNIKLDKSSFSYGPRLAPAMESISGLFKSGKFYGIIGPNGGGKSTLLKIMRGLYQCSSGRVLLDDQEIQQFTQKQLSGKIGYLPQEPGLIAASIYDNLTFGMDDKVDPQDIRKSCRDAGCLEFISSLPHGFNSLIGSSGITITPGMRQKLALARLYLRQPQAYLMDEPTNHLDEQSLQAMKTYLKEQSKTRLVVVVSHHIGLLNLCDGLVIIEQGKLTQSGPAAVILKRLGVAHD